MTLRFGEYEVERELARGGMGVVYVARHTRLGRRVALKVLSAGVSDSSSERFDIETRAVAQLDHPNVVRIHEVGLERGRAFFAMELVEGETLDQRLQRDGPFDPRQAVVVIEAIARAVEHAHARGVLHRDLKPANVLLTTDDRPLLTDFGLARELSDERERLTRTGEVLGTPGYMPPEQANGEVHAIGPASDVYGLGATLYALLCGRPPFVASTLPILLAHIIGHPPEPPRALRPELDPELEAICLRTLEKAPARRYASAGALADDLLRYLHGEQVLALRSRRRSLTVMGTLAGLSLLAAGLYSAFADPERPPSPTVTATSAPTPTPTPTRTTAPWVAPTSLRRDWSPPAQVSQEGNWRGGFVATGEAWVVRLTEKRMWILDPAALALRPVALPGRVQAFTTLPQAAVLLINKRLVSFRPGQPPTSIHSLTPDWTAVEQLEAHASGEAIALVGRVKGALRAVVIDLSQPQVVTTVDLPNDPRRVTCLALSTELVIGTGAFAVGGLGEGTVYRQRRDRLAQGLHTWSPGTGYPTAVSFTPAGVLAVGTSGGQAYLFLNGSKARPTPLRGKTGLLGFAHQGAVRGLVFSPKGRRLYTSAGELAQRKGELAVWEAQPGAAPKLLEHQRLPRHAVPVLRLSPDQQRLLVLTHRGPELWSVPSP